MLKFKSIVLSAICTMAVGILGCDSDWKEPTNLLNASVEADENLKLEGFTDHADIVLKVNDITIFFEPSANYPKGLRLKAMIPENKAMSLSQIAVEGLETEDNLYVLNASLSLNEITTKTKNEKCYSGTIRIFSTQSNDQATITLDNHCAYGRENNFKRSLIAPSAKNEGL